MSAETAAPSQFRLAWRFALRELRGGLRGFRLFLACLALGVGVIAAIGSIRASIEAGLAREGASLLGGDAELTFTYRFASEDESAWMDKIARNRSEVVEFRSMAVVGEERALTQVKSVDAAYPLRGEVRLTSGQPLHAALTEVDGRPGAVMEKVLADRLGLSAGDGFRLGTQEFRLSGLLAWEPDAAGSGFSIGPRTLVHTDALAQSGLLAPGTLYSTKYRLTLPPPRG